VLIRLAAYTGEERYDEAATGALRLLANAMGEYPQAFGEALGAVELRVTGMQELALVGPLAAEPMTTMRETAFAKFRPNLIAAHVPSDVDGEHAIPLLSHRTMRGGQPTAYVCRNFVCQLPVTTPQDLAKQLGD
jgi:uncharacterized protein YyaL (SSP411 family)